MDSVTSRLIHIPVFLALLAVAADYDPRDGVCRLLSDSPSGSFRTRQEKPQAAVHPQRVPGAQEREKEMARAEFTRSFGGLQNVGYAMRNEHEARILRPDKLEKYAKTINKHARTLRGLLMLGELDEPIRESQEPIDTSKEFDLSIRRLARLIYTFAHNPVHQNRRVFDTDQARRALIDLETIIVLSKSLGNQAKGYTTE